MKGGLAQAIGAAGHTVVDLEAQDVETPLDYPDHAEAVGQRSQVTPNEVCSSTEAASALWSPPTHSQAWHPRRVGVMTE